MDDQAIVTHPFDREEEVSVEQLFTSFCNHLTLGQWELTRVCLQGLFKKGNQLKKPLNEILRAIIDQPHHASSGSQSVPSPFHLSWLCLVEYLDLFTDEKDQIPEQIVKKVEFGLLLYLACKNAPPNVIQDIDDYHSQIVYRDPDLFASGVSDLPTSTLSFLKQLLSNSPLFGQAVINDLTSKGKGFLKNNQLLQQLYLDVIDEQLIALESDAVEMQSTYFTLLSTEENTRDFKSKPSKIIYQMLSYMNPTPEMLSLSMHLDELFKKLINLVNNGGHSCLDKGTLYSCLLSQSNTYLIDKFCAIENKVRFIMESHHEMLWSRSAAQGFRQQKLSVGPAVQVCYTQSFIENRRDAWHHLFFHVMEGNHVLENVVVRFNGIRSLRSMVRSFQVRSFHDIQETALVFVKEGEFESLMQLLSPVEFSRLKPLVLLLGWPYCYSCQNAKNLLNALWNPLEETADPSLHQACQKLAYQVQLVQWCTEKARPLLASSESGSTRHQQASEMFQGLESHSVLHVLHKSVNLAHLPEKEVFELLKKRPVFTPLEADKEKRVSKSLKTEGSAPRQTVESSSEERQDSEIHPEVQRDIFLYHSYCALRNFMEAVTSSLEENDSKDYFETQSEKSPTKLSTVVINGTDASSDIGCEQGPSYTQVASKLKAGKAHLSQVYPLAYRVEILEDIFSLLFGTYEDLYEGRTQQTESDDVETMDEESRSLSASNRTGSWESLASSVDLSVDVLGPLSPLKDQDKILSPKSGLQTSDSQQKHKETAPLVSVDSASRRQLFKNERSSSDSSLLKKLHKTADDEEHTVSAAQQAQQGDAVVTRHSENDSLSGNFHSSKGSSRAAASDNNDLKLEFVIDDEVVPDVLKTLKECLMELNSAKFTELKKEKSDPSSTKQDCLQTSVLRDNMEQRISRLGQYINEAQWRFQLVSWNSGTNNHKTTRNSRKRLSRKLQVIASSDELRRRAEEAQGEDSDNTEGRAEITRMSKRNGAGSKENSGESSSHLSQDTVTTGPEENKEKIRKKKIQRRRLTSRTSATEVSSWLTKDDSVIARMLSSPDTLIYMCMRKDNYERAHQVIKMFNMAENPSAQAAVFAEKYAKNVKHLESLQPKPRRVMVQSLSKSRKPLGGLGAVAMAAASGSHASLVSSRIDELLTTPSLAAVLNPSLKPDDLASGNSTLVKFLDPNMVPTMLCMDLACTVQVSWSVCKALLEMAKSRITEGPSLGSSKPNSLLLGIKPFMNQLDDLLNQEQAPASPQSPSVGIAISMTPKPNALELLLVGCHPVAPKDLDAHRKLLSNQEKALRRLEQALEEGDAFIQTLAEAVEPSPGHKHVGGQASFKRAERHIAVRIAMVELQEAFNCVKSASHVTTAVGGGPEERFDYMSSLFKHVDALATLLLKWKSVAAPPDGSVSRPGSKTMVSNPFVVLNDGIAETLGTPMFERNIPPKDLEEEAEKLHVNLSKVIVYNCCPAVPSLGEGRRRDVHWPSSEPVILNTGSRWTESARDPNTVARDLLSRMIKMLKDVAETHGGVVDARTAVNAIRTTEFQAIVRGSAELQSVNLDLLESDAAKVCFFVNTLNLLIAHASLIQFADGSTEDVTYGESTIIRHAVFTRLMDALSSSGGEGKGGDAVPLTALERIAFLKQHCYFIGQMGVVSAFDLQYVILHKGLLPPSTFGEGVIMCFPERSTDLAKRKYRLTTAEKRVIFAICDGCVSSPLLQVFVVDELDAQLSAAVVSYINSRVSLNQQTGQVTLPEILHWYRKDFEIRSVNSVDSSAGPDVSLLLQMEPYLYPDTAETLQKMLSSITEITFTPFCWTFGYRFESAILERSSSSSVLQLSNSVPDSLYLSMELSVLARTRRTEKRGLFSLNETALEYLEKKSPLVAALASLVCSAPDKMQLPLEDCENYQSTPQDCSNESTEFPFQVALEKTGKFPVLQRYIVSKLYTIADMLTLAPANSDESDGSCGSYDLIKLDSNLQVLQDGIRPPEISLFSVALASEGSLPLQNALLRASDFYLRKGYFEDLLELINSSDLRGDGTGGPAIDFLLSSAILSKGGTRSQLRGKLKTVYSQLDIRELKFSHSVHKKPWTLLPKIKDPEQLAELVLGNLSNWKAKTCIDLIELCLSRALKNVGSKEELERRRKKITIHQEISLCAKSPQYLTTKDQTDGQVTSLKQWQGVSAASEDEPRVVMDFLLSAQQFDLAAEWAELHVLPQHFHKTIKECQVKQLLSQEEHMGAYRILEGLQDQDMCLAICDSLLSQNLHVGQTLFIIQFMLTNIPSLLSPVRMERLMCTKMGAKALLCLPDSARPNYEHLVSRPPLLLEQLLMNMKVEWAAKVFQRIQVDLSCLEDAESLGDHGCTVKGFDQLLSTYSAKALEFQVVQLEPGQTRELCSSMMQALTKTPSSSPTFSTTMGGRLTPFHESGRYTPVTSTPVKERGSRESVAGSLERKAQTIPRRKISADSRVFERDRKNQRQSTPTAGSLGRKISQTTATPGGQHVFIPPSVPPKMADWMPDQQVSKCVICSEKFSMFNRRHHCRSCGRVVCGTCSQHNQVVEGYGKNPVRVCDVCFDFFYSSRFRPHHEEFTTSIHSDPVPLDKGRSAQDHMEYSTTSSAFGSFLERTSSTEWLADLNARCLWKLSLDEENNSILREEFFYEQAPSASLCVSVLDLHSDTKACGRLILDLCNSLSQKLVPVAPGVRNEEVDHNLVISMIRYLLFNAKLKMMKTGETQGVELCDTYLGHVDLMKFLVESNCGDIPSLRDLMHPDSARRLRDRFIEAERLSLAMEVSTKCGLDPSGVWGAAGFALLQAGDFPGAREKFSRCMKLEEGGKQHQQNNSQYLEKIIDILQTSPVLTYRQSTDDLMSPFLGLLENSRNFQPGNSYLDPKRFDECLFYLRKYGSPSSLVAFYVRHGFLNLACRYIIDQRCSAEVFLESLFMRLVLKGKWTQLKEQMETADPTLHSWMPYLTATCKFLLRRSFHHLLYEVQVFMRDFFRAAQTCIRFYEGVAGGPVTSYENLHSRLHFLEDAKRHIEAVIAEKKSPKGTVNTVFAYLRQRSTASAKTTAEQPSHVNMSLSELNSHVNTINLQTEVTNFMHQCAVERGGLGLLRASEGSCLPTLFGNGHVRGEVVVQVLLAGATVQDGFSLASRIIQDFNLPAARIYVDAGRSLARRYKFSHIEDLLRCSGETGQVTDRCHDEIILACVSIVSADQSQAKHLEALIKLLKSDTNKINAFVMCGKLKSAYLIAVKGDRVDAIQEIAEVAMNTGQSKMVEICNKFLNQFEKKREAQERRVLQRKQGAEANR